MIYWLFTIMPVKSRNLLLLTLTLSLGGCLKSVLFNRKGHEVKHKETLSV
jgi:hypothetical protein